MRHLIISLETGRVVNVILWDVVSPYLVPEDHRLLASETGEIGDAAPDLTPAANSAE